MHAREGPSSVPSRLAKAVDEIEDDRLRQKAVKLLRESPRYHRGLVASADSSGKVGWIPWQKATAQGPTGTPENQIVERAYTKPAILPRNKPQKRSDIERVESLARRFWDVVKDNPKMAPLLLSEMQREYWMAGQPVTYEDMKIAAIELLKKAAQEASRRK